MSLLLQICSSNTHFEWHWTRCNQLKSHQKVSSLRSCADKKRHIFAESVIFRNVGKFYNKQQQSFGRKLLWFTHSTNESLSIENVGPILLHLWRKFYISWLLVLCFQHLSWWTSRALLKISRILLIFIIVNHLHSGKFTIITHSSHTYTGQFSYILI